MLFKNTSGLLAPLQHVKLSGVTGLSENCCYISASLAAEQDFTLFPFKSSFDIGLVLVINEPPPCSTRHNTSHTSVWHVKETRNKVSQVSRGSLLLI